VHFSKIRTFVHKRSDLKQAKIQRFYFKLYFIGLAHLKYKIVYNRPYLDNWKLDSQVFIVVIFKFNRLSPILIKLSL
jgi:hypothetical protein